MKNETCSLIFHSEGLDQAEAPTVTAAQIVFESRLGAHDVGNDCLMSIDGTNFRILQKGAVTRGNAFGSHKYAGKSALRYKLEIDILAGNLVWVS